jgi:hypothetical protein
LPRRNDRANPNLRPRPQGGLGDTGTLAKLRNELRYSRSRLDELDARRRHALIR